MFMILGAAMFLILMGSAGLGLVMLLVALGFIFTRTWRRAGLIILGAGGGGAVLGVFILLALGWLLGDSQTSVEVWIIFAAAGFGWAALISAAVVGLVALLRQPNRWVERKRNANA